MTIIPRFRDISLKNKLRLIILLTSGILLLLMASAFITSELLIFRRSMITELLTLTDLMGMNSTGGILFEDKTAASENLASLRAKPHILMAQIFVKNDEVFASYFRDEPLQTRAKPKIMDYYLSNPEVQDHHQIDDNYFFHNDYIEVFKKIIFKKDVLGTLYIQSDLKEFQERLFLAGGTITTVLLIALLLGFILASQLQQLITTPLYSLLKTMKMVSVDKNYSLREQKPGNDEVGTLVEGFNDMLAQVEERDRELALANEEITELNALLKEDNLRMSAELEVTRRLQQMVLPRPEELCQIQGLDIAGFMEPAAEVGGDYYDVLQYQDRVKIAIGDVTGHGLESGVLMLMVQMAVRTLLVNGVSDPETFLTVLNRVVYDNAQRIQTDKNLTLSLLDYQAGTLQLTGQHEDVLLVRQDGQVERIDTFELGFAVGLKADISKFVSHLEIPLQPGEGIVLYTDGITEAQNIQEEQYGIERLCDVVSHHWQQKTASEIQQAVIANVRQYMGEQKVLDDITIVVIKQNGSNQAI